MSGKLGLVLMGSAMISKSLIQFSVDGPGCVPSLLFDLRPNYGRGNEDNSDLLQKVPCMHCPTQYPQALLSMEFSRQENWSGLPFLFPGDLPNPGIKPGSPVLQVDALLSELPGKTNG